MLPSAPCRRISRKHTRLGSGLLSRVHRSAGTQRPGAWRGSVTPVGASSTRRAEAAPGASFTETEAATKRPAPIGKRLSPPVVPTRYLSCGEGRFDVGVQAFLETLRDSGVDVRFCDLPDVKGATGRFLLAQMAAVAELEAGLISERTKAALAAKGSPRWSMDRKAKHT